MNPKTIPFGRLQVIQGGLHQSMCYGNLRIVSAPAEAPPFAVDAMAYEEDTYLIMSAQPESTPQDIHPVKLMAELARLKPETPGTVVVRGKNPFRFLAVVHNVDNVPTWRKEWIEKALGALFKEARVRKIAALGLPVLGAQYGTLKIVSFAKLLAKALQRARLEILNRIWVIAQVPDNARLIETLQSELRVHAGYS